MILASRPPSKKIRVGAKRYMPFESNGNIGGGGWLGAALAASKSLSQYSVNVEHCEPKKVEH